MTSGSGNKDNCTTLAAWTLECVANQGDEKLKDLRTALARQYQALINTISKRGWTIDIAGSPPQGFAASSQPDPSTKWIRLSLARSTLPNSPRIVLDPDGVAVRTCTVLHELCNCAQIDRFVLTEDEARNGNLIEDQYVDREIRLEVISSLNAAKVFRDSLSTAIQGVDPEGTRQALEHIEQALTTPIDQQVERLKQGIYGDYYRTAFRRGIATGLFRQEKGQKPIIDK